MSETLSLMQVLIRIQEFTNIPPTNGVNNFVLEGSIQRSPTHTLVAAALFPSPSAAGKPWSVIASVNGEGRAAMPKYQSKIAHLEVSERIKSFGIQDDQEIRYTLTQVCRLQGLPIITISFAKYQNSGDDLILLNSIAGISPETAVR